MYLRMSGMFQGMPMLGTNNETISGIDNHAPEEIDEIVILRQKLIDELNRSVSMIARETGLVIGVISECGQEWVLDPKTAVISPSPKGAHQPTMSQGRLSIEAICDNWKLGEVYID